MSPGGRPRLGLVGFGAASRMMLDPLTTDGDFEFVAGADPDPFVRSALEEQWGVASAATAAEMYERFDLDAVYIAAPTVFHEPLAVAALEAGLHVLVEKPMAVTLEDALSMMGAAERAGRVLMECHKRSVDRPIATMWKLIDLGMVGAPRVLHRIHYSSWFYRPRAEEERDPRSGGIVLRQGAHEMDILRLLGGVRPVRVWGWTGDYDKARPGEGSYMAWLEFADGTRASSVYSGYDHFDTTEFTNGLLDAPAIGRTRRKAGALVAGADEGEVKRHDISRRSTSRADDPLFGFTLVNGESADLRPAPDNGVFLYGEDGRRRYFMDGPAGTRAIAKEFHDAIVENAPVVHSGQWGLSVLELCLAIRRSAEQGGESVALEYQYDISRQTVEAVLGSRNLDELPGSE